MKCIHLNSLFSQYYEKLFVIKEQITWNYLMSFQWALFSPKAECFHILVVGFYHLDSKTCKVCTRAASISLLQLKASLVWQRHLWTKSAEKCWCSSVVCHSERCQLKHLPWCSTSVRLETSPLSLTSDLMNKRDIFLSRRKKEVLQQERNFWIFVTFKTKFMLLCFSLKEEQDLQIQAKSSKGTSLDFL